MANLVPMANASVRVRFPIAIKLALATTGLIALVATALVSVGYLRTQRDYESEATRLRSTEIEALSALGFAVTRNLAQTIAAPLVDSDFTVIDDTLRQVVGTYGTIASARVFRPEG